MISVILLKEIYILFFFSINYICKTDASKHPQYGIPFKKMQMKFDHQITLIGEKCKATSKLKQTKIIFETCKKSYNHIILPVKTFFSVI